MSIAKKIIYQKTKLKLSCQKGNKLKVKIFTETKNQVNNNKFIEFFVIIIIVILALKVEFLHSSTYPQKQYNLLLLKQK